MPFFRKGDKRDPETQARRDEPAPSTEFTQKRPMSELIALIEDQAGQVRDSDLDRYQYREIVRRQKRETDDALAEARGVPQPKYTFGRDDR